MLKVKGQSVTEYMVCALLIIGLSISGLLFLSDNINKSFSEILTTHKQNVNALSTRALNPSSSKLIVHYTQTNIIVTLSQNSDLHLSLPSDFSEVVKTAGANGATEIVANSLTSMTQQLLDSGKINLEQANTLFKLANQAHHLAGIQKEFETFIAQYGNNSETLKTKPIVIDGQVYTNIYEAAKSIGVDPINGNGTELQQFWNLFSEAYNANHNWPPELLVILQYHSNIISHISDTLHATIRNIVLEGGNPNDLQKMTAEQITHSEAASICVMDTENKDSGIHCS